MNETNWAGSYRYTATRIARPTSLHELRDLLSQGGPVRALGTRHTFNDLADTDGMLVATTGLPTQIELDGAARTVTVSGGTRYGELGRYLHARGWALHNLASLPHISVAGAVATATHGSGDRCGNLATAVVGLRILTAGGELVELTAADDELAGAVVSLGALGIVTDVTLRVEPTYDVRQRLFNGLSWDALVAHFDQVTSAAYAVSLFTRWQDDGCLVWLKERADAPSDIGDDFLGARVQTQQQHVIDGMNPGNCTQQLAVPGPWSERLPHFRLEFTPSSGEEIQSEYLVPRDHAPAAIQEIRSLAPTITPLLHISEIRTIAADELWLSTAYDSDMVGIHFTWKRDAEAVGALLPTIEAALLPLGARPHWGKWYLDVDNVVPQRYARLGDFRELAHRFDPAGRFRNRFLDRLLAG